MANTYYCLSVRYDTVVLAPINPLDNEGFCLSVLNGAVVVARTNPHDESQHWFKDTTHANSIKDDEGKPSFALVNKVTGDAIKRSLHFLPLMRLVRFGPANVDESEMWTEGGDVGEGFRCIRAVNNTRLHFVAMRTDYATVVLLRDWEGVQGDCSWMIRPWVKTTYLNAPRDGGGSGFSVPETFRIFCKADEGLSATVRDGAVVLEVTDPHDERQHWIKDSRRIKDEEGYRAFALVNNYTGEAIKRSQGEGFPVGLEYNPKYQEQSVMWTESRDDGGRFGSIRMVNNIRLNFRAAGTIVVLSKGATGGEDTRHSGCDGPRRAHYCYKCVLKRLAPHSDGDAPERTHYCPDCLRNRLAQVQMM